MPEDADLSDTTGRAVNLAALFIFGYLRFWPKAEVIDTQICVDLSSAFHPKAEQAAICPKSTLPVISEPQGVTASFSANRYWCYLGRGL
jgi:hypothetical protein